VLRIERTHIHFQVYVNAAEVQIHLWDVNGKPFVAIPCSTLDAGEYAIPLNIKGLSIAHQNYVYPLQVTNNQGSYRPCERMTAME
jgi:hypothetical protein